MFRIIRNFIESPYKRILYLSKLGFYDRMDDKKYLQKLYKAAFGKELDWDNPQTFNEKLQWLKLYDRKPIYTTMVDKYEVKKYVAEKIGEEYIISTLGVWDNFDDIDFDKLPDQFVLKCTHDSGGLVICKDKRKLDIATAKKKMEKALRTSFYSEFREWPYKDVKPRIIAEQYMADESGGLIDYKFFCFDGVPRIMFIATDRENPNEETKFDFFDMDFNHLDIRNGHPNAKLPPRKPKRFELMKQLASKLSNGIPHVRVDMYEVNGKVYFGELTFYHWGGVVKFEPDSWDKILGDWLVLPRK